MNLTQVQRVFEDNNVKTALIVDDVYDDIAEFEDDDLQRAYALIERDDLIQDAWTGAGGMVPVDLGALADQLKPTGELARLLNAALRTTEDSPLRTLARAIFAKVAEDKIAKLKPLDDLRALLDGLGIAVSPFGSDGPGVDEPKHPLIFMDYYLGPKGAPSIDKSIDRVMRIVSRYPQAERPIVVLMSSELASAKKTREFRDRSELLGSQFEFVIKAKFGDQGFAFVASLADMVEFISQSRTIGTFVDAWKSALTDAATEFVQSIRTLDVQDYYHIRNKLGDGAEHRFGDHVSTLFSGYFRKLVEDRSDLRNVTSEMNGLAFTGMPPNPFSPSEVVSAMAFAASFQDLSKHPALAGKDATIELGDVFFRQITTGKKTEASVSIVVSQDCDLEHGKVDNVFMIDGVVHKHSSKRLSSEAADRHTLLRVDLFQHEGDNYTIEWDARRTRVLPLASFNDQILDRGFVRVARLRAVQALALQQKFAAHLTRVAMPDSLPTYRYTAGEVFIREGVKLRSIEVNWKASARRLCVIGPDSPRVSIVLDVFDRIRLALLALDRTGLDSAKIDETISALSDVEVLRSLRNVHLVNGEALVGAILIRDSEKQIEAGFNPNKAVFLILNLHP